MLQRTGPKEVDLDALAAYSSGKPSPRVSPKQQQQAESSKEYVAHDRKGSHDVASDHSNEEGTQRPLGTAGASSGIADHDGDSDEQYDAHHHGSHHDGGRRPSYDHGHDTDTSGGPGLDNGDDERKVTGPGEDTLGAPPPIQTNLDHQVRMSLTASDENVRPSSRDVRNRSRKEFRIEGIDSPAPRMHGATPVEGEGKSTTSDHRYRPPPHEDGHGVPRSRERQRPPAAKRGSIERPAVLPPLSRKPTKHTRLGPLPHNPLDNPRRSLTGSGPSRLLVDPSSPMASSPRIGRSNTPAGLPNSLP